MEETRAALRAPLLAWGSTVEAEALFSSRPRFPRAPKMSDMEDAAAAAGGAPLCPFEGAGAFFGLVTLFGGIEPD